MLQRFYVHNFRCLENFELSLIGEPCSLLIGKNGSGKSTIARALTLLQRIGRGVSKVGQLIAPDDLARGRKDVPVRFELEVLLDGKNFKYTIAFELPEKFRELRVFDEQLIIDGNLIYTRKQTQVELMHDGKNASAHFMVDWHMVTLPIIQSRSASDPVQIFKTWLARMIILAPIPSAMTGNSNGDDTLEPVSDGSNFGEWFSCLLSQYPAAYTTIIDYLKTVTSMHDLGSIKNPLAGNESKRMLIQFASNGTKLDIYFSNLSDGEKCFFLCAVVLAANEHYGPLFCFWDEPDNYLALSEVGHFIITLRRSFSNGGQLLVTSHHEEAIRRFSDENTLVLDRKSHFEPTLLRRLDELGVVGDLVTALIRGDVAL